MALKYTRRYLVASGKRISQGAHPPASSAGNKIHLYRAFYFLRLPKLDKYATIQSIGRCLCKKFQQ